MAKPGITTLDRCTPSQLRALLTLAASQPGDGTSLPTHLVNGAAWQQQLTEACAGTAWTGAGLVATTCARQTSLDTLREIKELAKTLLVDAATEAHQATATGLYHLACSAAVAHYGVNISSRAPGTHLALYEDLATALGNTPPGDVFRAAIDWLLTHEADSVPSSGSADV